MALSRFATLNDDRGNIEITDRIRRQKYKKCLTQRLAKEFLRIILGKKKEIILETQSVIAFFPAF